MLKSFLNLKCNKYIFPDPSAKVFDGYDVMIMKTIIYNLIKVNRYKVLGCLIPD